MSQLEAPRAAGLTPLETSFPQRLIGILLEPGRVLEEVAREPDFIKPLLVLIGVTATVTEVMLSKVGMERIIRTSLMESGRAAQLSPAQMEQAIAKGVAVSSVFVRMIGFLGPPVFLAIVAAVGLIILNGFFGVHVGFKKVFSVACYADLPSVLRGVMAAAVILFGDPNAFNPQSPAPSNPGFFLSPLHTSQVTMVLASSLDIFVVWFLILLAIGLSRVSGGRVKSSSIFWAYFGVWMILILARMGFALLS